MKTYDPDRLIAQTLLQLMKDDMDHMDHGGFDPAILVQVVRDGVAYYVPLNWIEEYAPSLRDSWEKFMAGQTYCEHGFYICDVSRFLRSKAR